MEELKYYCDKCGKELSLISEKEKGIESRIAFTIEYPKMSISRFENVIERKEKTLDLCKNCFLKLQNEIEKIIEVKIK